MLAATEVLLSLTLCADIALFRLLWREHSTPIQRVFLVYIAGITLWCAAIFANLWMQSAMIEKIIFASAALFLTAQVWFAHLFSRDIPAIHRRHYWILGIGAFFLGFSFADGALFSELRFNPGGYTIITNGYLSSAYACFALAYATAPIVLLSLAYRHAEDERLRAQIRYLITGFSLFLSVTILTNSFLPVFFGVYLLNAIGPVFSLVFAASVFYAVWKYEFLDLRTTLQRGLIYSALVALLVAGYAATLFAVSRAFGLNIDEAPPVSAGIMMLVGVLTAAPLERTLRKKTDRLFFTDHYDYPTALQTLLDTVASHNTPSALIDATQEALVRTIKCEWARYVPAWEEAPAREVCGIALISKQRTMGRLSLGPKKSGERYRADDTRLLQTLVIAFAIALEKTELLAREERHARDLEKKVEERTRHLRELQEYQRRMIGDISHALQTPLTVLRASLGDMPLRQSLTIAKSARITESVDALSKLVYDFLHLAKLETLPAQEHAVFSLSETVAHIAEYVETNCAEHGICLVVAVENGILMHGNRRQIEELITNLLSNAVKYTASQPHRHINLSLTIHEDRATLTVADTGTGIPADALPHLFERFYRAKDNSRPGTGLGLSICKQIADMHGGTISAASGDKGSAFVVTLPLLGSV